MTATTEESVVGLGGGANYSPTTPPDSSMITSTTTVTVSDKQLMEEGGEVGGNSLKESLEGEESEVTRKPNPSISAGDWGEEEDEDMEEVMANMDLDKVAPPVEGKDPEVVGEEPVTDLGNASKGEEEDDDGLHIDLDKEGMEVEEDKGNDAEGGKNSAVPAEIPMEEPTGEGEVNTEEDRSNNDLSKEGGDDGDCLPGPVAAPEVEEDDLVVVGGSDDKDKEAGSSSAKDTHLEREAELQAYLDSLKPKPKRKTIKEMLMAMPGYKDIASLKPKIGGGVQNKMKDVVIFDEAENRRRSKRQQQIEALKDRFVKHALVAPPKKTKGEHIKLKIQSKEEDSQGIEHLKENEVEYVRDPMNEEEDPMGPLVSTSPQGEKPGAKRASLRQNLLEIINSKRRAVYEQTMNEDNENNKNKKKEEVVEDESEEEIVEDDEISDEDSEVGEEEEELEYLLSGPKKKKSAFIEDEAEDEDGDDENDDDDDDDDSDSSEDEEVKAKPKSKPEEKAELESIGDSQSQDSLPGPAVLGFKNNEQESNTKESENENSASMDFGAALTPKVCSVTINPLTPSDFSRHSDGLSPLIPRIQRTTEFVDMDQRNPGITSVADSLSNVISENNTKFDDLVDLCSGKFVTQRNSELLEIQDEDDEFENFDFGDDDDICEENNKPDESRECVKTPVNTSTRNAVDGITPKLAAKPTIARRSMQFEMEQEGEEDAEKSIDKEEKSDNQLVDSNLDDDDDEEVGARKSIGKKKRLHFSDDEDDADNDIVPSDPVSENEESGEEEEMESPLDIEPEEPVVHNPFFNKRGMLKRKFVDDEAELSGSEEGSADEDEGGLNDYEDEEGDDEEIDEELVRNQVERAHLKHLLDSDDRNIRLLQNKFCENGDLTGAARVKTTLFKLTASDLNDDALMGGSDEEDQAQENPEELLQKQEWVEKRKWMSENSHLLENDADESQSLLTSFKIGKQTLKRIESFVDTSTSDSKDLSIKETSNRRKSFLEEFMNARKAAANSSNSSLNACSEGFNFGQVGSDTNLSVDESSKSMSEPMFGVSWTKNIATAAPKKGSFLSRGGMMLAKLAETSKPGDTVSNVKNNSRNFVFSHITPPTDKTDGSTSKVKRATNKRGCNAQAKKIKVDRSFNNLDEASKQSSVFKFL